MNQAVEEIEPVNYRQYGQLAHQVCGKLLPLEVLKSGAGYYIGTTEDFCPCTRESRAYFRHAAQAEEALRSGSWVQKESP